MKTNRGKTFEKNVKDALIKAGYYTLRLQDSMGGFAGVNNPCDFIAFKSPQFWMIECKAIRGGTLNFKAHIRPNQEEGMYNAFMSHNDIYAGFLVWFMDYDIIKFYPIHELKKAKEKNIKSFTYLDTYGYNVPAQKLRVNLIPNFANGIFEYRAADLYKFIKEEEK